MTETIPPDAVVMCSPADKSCFADDVICDCAGGCGARICHRPYVPANVRKMCVSCVGELLKDQNVRPEFSVLKRTVEELELYWSKPKGPKQ